MFQFLVIVVNLSTLQLLAGLCPRLYYKMMMSPMKNGDIFPVITFLVMMIALKD